jgi:hypothetical protein
MIYFLRRRVGFLMSLAEEGVAAPGVKICCRFGESTAWLVLGLLLFMPEGIPPNTNGVCTEGVVVAFSREFASLLFGVASMFELPPNVKAADEEEGAAD